MKAQSQETVELYRKEGSHLYRLDKNGDAYIHCYQNARLTSKSALIKAYEAACDEQDEDCYI